MHDTAKHTNRLIHETSPYLLQHAHNPVDWYPWGEEALVRAKDEQKPILLSIGYSACHWCHVMERESFENEEIAAVMNDLFINIKVDREERLDLDEIYMNAIQIMTRQGGWPMRHSQPEATRILINTGTEGVGYHRAGFLRNRRLREEENREREERKPLVRSEDWDYILFSDAVGPMEVLEVHPKAKLMESWDEILDFLKQKYRDQKPKVAIYRSSAIAYPRD